MPPGSTHMVGDIFITAGFFSGGIEFQTLLINPGSWDRLTEYFFSVYGNTLYDLGLYSAVLFLLFLLRNIRQKHRIRSARKHLPLVIGGWGTRGKSSVERLKCALFNALGYGVLSKTTGCEAMFLHARAFDTMREMFIFRPYDKATIWEQHALTLLARDLGADVFLWECMGLTPAYVKILQRGWMKDDMSSITNTYPDHEDIQGPAGIDIPEVMACFIPSRAALTTTEEQMLPILKEAAGRLKTTVHAVGWLEAGLIAPDISNRFSYEEHPYNIALVLETARNLGLPEDYALKAMADHVIPDIGVLKVYPAAPIRSRRLEFVSGNSANERYGALSNWRRAGFDRRTVDDEPHIWISTVVNNRADRIPRSRVFASVLAEDISADRHFLIGSNLSGLTGYIEESWDAYAARLKLWPDSDDPEADAVRGFTQKARWMRIPTSPDQIRARLGAMISGQGKELDTESLVELWDSPDTLKQRLDDAGPAYNSQTIVKFLESDIAGYNEYADFTGRIRQKGLSQKEKLQTEHLTLLKTWFQRKFVVIWDYYATGNQIINKICEETPPGLYNRIMGLQNIKGTGLDFVYAWQAWERCYNALNQLDSDDPYERGIGRRVLGSFQEYNILCEEYAYRVAREAGRKPYAQNEKFQAELTMVISTMRSVLDGVSLETDERGRRSWAMKLVGLIEAFQDAADGVKRRKTADLIYRDLAAERISHERAARELQNLNKRQKGGWLLSRAHEIRRRSQKKKALDR